MNLKSTSSKFTPHGPWFPVSRKVNYVYCSGCGLVLFNNKRTKKALNKTCNHPEK